VFFFEQLVKRGINCFQESISKRLHNHSFINIISNLPSNLHWACLRLYVGLSVGIWLSIHPIILFFHLVSNVFSTTLRTKLGLSHPSILSVSHCICSQLLNPMGIHIFCYTHGGEKMALHVVGQHVFMVIAKDVGFQISQEQTHVLLPPTLQLSHCQLTLCY
jgi:hypothetical protein